MIVAKWFWVLLVVWCITGLPILIIGIGFAGIEFFAFKTILLMFQFEFDSLESFLTTLVGRLVSFLPVLALPFALKRRQQ